ncbi:MULTISPECIES: DUF494 family protein [Neisseria]|uniref:Protein Smg homolog n=1 Tax=Neisseria animaloris TaxID=326522 RepID=A0A1X3CIM4_9NEIS|nr:MULTISPECIES: DUF494 family protein [Neisseria]MDO1510661.1 DUF494 family protein [Neisseria sp. MVDL19-042950]MDO1516951.1 DUF494 family protein [Neisseria sp. MVDL18-041461]MDO1564313.1 DUF494 family protein [Neisseria sp. MVDL20-010259]MDO5073808.1 DUF494 family protein [Neisseria animaloris]OSI07446.1 hypothetical protein BWD08_07890 [Neisseria animaloris]
MAEVIAFLIKHFHDFDACPPPSDLGQILEDIGFDDIEIGHALMLLEVLANSPSVSTTQYRSDALRVYCPEELEALPQEVVDLLYFLDKAQAINGEQREFVVHALLHMPPEEITVDMAKVLTLLILWAHKSEPPILIGDELMMALHGKSIMH